MVMDWGAALQDSQNDMSEFARGTSSYQQFSSQVNQQFQPQEPMGGFLGQAQQFQQQNPGYQNPQANEGFFQGLGNAVNYLAGAPGRGVESILPEDTPDLLREAAVNTANIAPLAAATVLTGGADLIPAAVGAGLGVAGMMGGEQLGNYLAPRSDLANTIQNTRLPGYVPLVGGANAFQIGGGLLGGELGNRLTGGSRPVEQAQPEVQPVEAGIPAQPQGFQSVEHQQGYLQGLTDRAQQPTWRDIPPEFQSRGPGDTDFTQGRKEGFMGQPPGTLFEGGLPSLSMDEAMAGIGPSNLTPAAGTGPGMAAFDQQRQSGIPGGETTAPINNVGGRGTGLPTGRVDVVDWNPIHNLFAAVGAPTQPLLTGLHLARFAPQEAFRPGVLADGLRAMGEAFAKGRAPDVMAHVNNDLGPNIPAGFRASDMRAATAATPFRPTAVQQMINRVPVVGAVLERFRAVNSALLGTMRDAHYNTAADRLARTDPGASPQMYRDLWREANNATGHQTLWRGDAGISQGMGVGWGALTARVQELGNTVLGSGAPVPGLAAGSRAEAFKTLMGVAATMAGTTALAQALGADVNTDKPFGNFGLESTFLRPVTSNGLFRTMYGMGGAGYDTLIRAAANIGHDLFSDDSQAALQHALAFGRGEFGVVPAGVIDSILGQDWKGDKYTWQDFLNEAKTGFMANQQGELGKGRSIPIAAGENLEALKAYGPEGLLRALPADLASSVRTTPINTTAGAFTYSAPADILQRAFPDSPLAQRALAGKDWTDLLPTEKHQIIDALQKVNPQVVQQIQEREQERYPATAMHSAAIDALQSRKTEAENRILDLYNSGQLAKPATRAAMFAVQDDYYKDKAKVDADPAYVKELAAFRSSGSDPTEAQKALDAYYQISQHYSDKADRQKAQADYIQWLNARDPELASRIVGAVQPRNQTELERLYQSGALAGR